MLTSGRLGGRLRGGETEKKPAEQRGSPPATKSRPGAELSALQPEMEQLRPRCRGVTRLFLTDILLD